MPERTNGAVLKTASRASGSWVRIPLPPPSTSGFGGRKGGPVESGSLDGVTVDSDRGCHVIEARGVLIK